MTNFTPLQSSLAENFKNRVKNVHILRGNELHFEIARGDAPQLGEDSPR